MAVNLSDIVFRRTALGAIPGPDRSAVEAVARMAGAELGWDRPRQEAEVDTVLRHAGAAGGTLEAVG